ncbi:MAG: HAD-IIB family hydrolase [Betaproteobacteria bacterium]
MKTVIFTDLDGSLLHPTTYSFEEATPALQLIKEKSIPLVLCSSKTSAEIEVYRKRLENRDPFIVENGGAIFVPVGYFPLLTGSALHEEYTVHAFGRPYQEIRKQFVRLRESLHIPVRGFGDMTVAEIAALTGLPQEEAALARKRGFGEPFVFEHGTDERFLKAAEEQGLHWTRGRFYYLMGNHDKGSAVRLLKEWYRNKHGKLITIGLGDGLNDLPLLSEVDHAVLIQRKDGSYDPGVDVPGLIKAHGIGPAGWNRAVLELLKR